MEEFLHRKFVITEGESVIMRGRMRGRVVVEYMEGVYRRRLGGWSGAPADASQMRTRAETAYVCERVSVDPSFVKLRRRFTLQAGFLVSVFLISYLTYLLLSAYARDFLSFQIVPSINVALVLGIGQFLLTFVLAWAFGRYSACSIDPLAEEIRDRVDAEEGPYGRVIR